MSHSETFHAIILKTYDVGEADRLCVLFTREKGRISARASGARKILSRLGAALMPFSVVRVDLKESSAGWIVAGALPVSSSSSWSLAAFTGLHEGIEILMRLIPHEGALPDVFNATLGFIDQCKKGIPGAPLAFSFRLLDLLGFLPDQDDIKELSGLGNAEATFINEARAGHLVTVPEKTGAIMTFRDHLLSSQLSSPLKAGAIIGTL